MHANRSTDKQILRALVFPARGRLDRPDVQCQCPFYFSLGSL